MCITPEVKLCVGLRNQDIAMATAQNPTAFKYEVENDGDGKYKRDFKCRPSWLLLTLGVM